MTDITNADGDLVDAVLAFLAALTISLALLFLWHTSAGRYAVEPSPVTAATAPDSQPVIANIEEP